MRRFFPFARWWSSIALFFLSVETGWAAFELQSDQLSPLGDVTITVSRESLESRSAVPVTTARAIDGRILLRVDSEPGLFSVQAGDLTASFVAGSGERLQLLVGRDGRSLKVAGGRDQELFTAYETFRAESLGRLVMPVRAALTMSRARGNEEVERLSDAEVTAARDHRRELNDFSLEKLRGSPALYAASLRWDGDHRLEDLASAVKEYALKNPGLEIARLLEQRIERFRSITLGAVAPALAGTSPEKKDISLNSLRGRYVLVDFWASWCEPCRVENRNYGELYDRYHAAGLEILAVSLDEKDAVWRAAIAKDKARWLHVSDLKGWQSPLAAAYNVTALPGSFLLDPEGRIIAKDLRGKQLAARVASLFPSAKKP
ncbi:MAG: TlpA disulfide reductase family protein [Opitutaceae bacterium]